MGRWLASGGRLFVTSFVYLSYLLCCCAGDALSGSRGASLHCRPCLFRGHSGSRHVGHVAQRSPTHCGVQQS